MSSVEQGSPWQEPKAQENQTFEFVTIMTRPTTYLPRDTSKKVRTHAMKDFLRKGNRENETGTKDMVTTPLSVTRPGELKGKFRLST